MGVIVFNGKSSRDLNVVVEHPPAYDTPEKDYDITSIPGRNGDLILDNGNYNNVDREYEIAIDARDEGFSRTVGAVMGWLRSASGYARLEDSYDIDYYRMACYRESTSVENILEQAGRATIAFDCMPQRFLKSGELPIVFTSSGTLINPTLFTAKPLIEVKKQASVSTTITIGTYTITIGAQTGVSGSYNVFLDCDYQNAYIGTTNWNSYISGTFPELISGDNAISFTNATYVSIIPRWWTI